MPQAADQPGGDRIAGVDRDDRRNPGLLGRESCGIPAGDNDIDLDRRELGDELWQAVQLPARAAAFEDEVFAVFVAALAEDADQGGAERAVFAERRGAAEAPNAIH